MISVEIDKISPSEHGIALGCVVRYGEGGPVRFAMAYIPIDLFDADCRIALMKMWDSMVVRHLEEEPRLFD